MASNRKVTKSQFSAGTTIDGADIDATVDEFVEEHNEVPRGFTDGRLTAVNYVAHWSPTKPHYTNSQEPGAGGTFTNLGRQVPVNYTSWTEHNFPFLVCRNWLDETFPLSLTVPDPPTLNNEYRHKGFASHGDLDLHEIWTRGTPTNTGMPTYIENDPAVADSMDINPGVNGFSSVRKRIGFPATVIPVYHPMNQRYLAATFSYYFDKPVVLSSINVVAASEHPISYFGAGQNLVGPTYFQMDTTNDRDYKAPAATVAMGATQYDDPVIRTTTTTKYIEDCTDGATNNIGETGNVFPGANSMGLGGSLSPIGNFVPIVQVSIDNEFNPEKRELNNLAVNIREMGHNAGAYKFNRLHPTSRRSGPAPATVGATFTDMQPEYPGGATWGVFITEQNLNIPIPAGSRVRFSIIVKGFNACHAFEWNSNLTVLEEVED